MAKQLMIYESAVPISVEKHKKVSVSAGESYAFAKEVNSVPLLAPEFITAAREHVIVFAGQGDAVFPTVILGLEAKKNDYVAKNGKWRGEYVPAFLRRYPFVFSKGGEDGKFVLCIDDTFSGVNEKGKGEALFDKDGGRTEYLNAQLQFNQQYQAQFERTQSFAKRLSEFGLLEPAQAQVKIDGKQGSLSGFQRINRDKLAGLHAKKLKDLAKDGELELCYMHLMSLANLPRMAEKLRPGG